MFNIGGLEILVIAIIALLFVGPDKLPQVAKTVTTGLRDLRRMANATQHELQTAITDLTREVERIPDAAPKVDAPSAMADTLRTHLDADGLDKVPPPSAAAPPPDGETLAVVAKRSADGAVRAPGPPLPHYLIRPADGAVARTEAAPPAEPAAAAPEAAQAAAEQPAG